MTENLTLFSFKVLNKDARVNPLSLNLRMLRPDIMRPEPVKAFVEFNFKAERIDERKNIVLG
jgi:hypothetical protein